MGTPGRRRALRALAKRKRSNKRRMKKGLKPIVGGKKVSRLPGRRKKRGRRKKKK